MGVATGRVASGGPTRRSSEGSSAADKRRPAATGARPAGSASGARPAAGQAQNRPPAQETPPARGAPRSPERRADGTRRDVSRRLPGWREQEEAIKEGPKGDRFRELFIWSPRCKYCGAPMRGEFDMTGPMEGPQFYGALPTYAVRCPTCANANFLMECSWLVVEGPLPIEE